MPCSFQQVRHLHWGVDRELRARMSAACYRIYFLWASKWSVPSFTFFSWSLKSWHSASSLLKKEQSWNWPEMVWKLEIELYLPLVIKLGRVHPAARKGLGKVKVKMIWWHLFLLVVQKFTQLQKHLLLLKACPLNMEVRYKKDKSVFSRCLLHETCDIAAASPWHYF